MGGLLDEAMEVQQAAKPQRCTLCKYFGMLPDDEAAEWDEVFRNQDVAHVTLRRLLNRHGVVISDNAVRHHRLRCL